VEGLATFAAMIGTSVLLGAVFVAIGYLISATVRDRGLAGGLAIGVWLLFVLIYDMALLGLLVVDKGRMISAGMLDVLLLLNPADAFRVLNLTGSGGVSQFAGMAGLSEDAGLSPAVLVTALLLWAVLPLGGAALALGRRQL